VEWTGSTARPKSGALKLEKNAVEEAECLTLEESERILWAAAPEWKTVFVLAVRIGLRSGEVLALRWQDIDLVASQVVVRRVWKGQEGPPKDGRTRSVLRFASPRVGRLSGPSP